MKDEYLENYEAEEFEQFEIYTKNALQSGIVTKYPSLSRFKKINEPIVRAELFSYELNNEKIWSQIPFAGTLIIPIYDVSKSNFLNRHGFEVSDLGKLIDFAKETGKVQFVLSKNPIAFKGLDHLDILFEELKPPMTHAAPIELFADAKKFEKWVDEFLTLAQISYVPWFLYENDMGIRENDQFVMNFLNNRAGFYGHLKAIGLNDVAETIANLLIDDPSKGHLLLGKYMQLTGQKFELLCSIHNQSIAHLGVYDIDPNIPKENFVFPFEIGNFIMKKLILHPTSYQACLDVILHYEQNDLYKILHSLQNAIDNNMLDKTNYNLNDLNSIMENAWNDAKIIKNRVNTVQDGISVFLGALGDIASTALIGTPLGLLAGLGFKVLDKHLGDASTSQKVVEKLNKNYLMNIFDFQQKYSLGNL